MSLLIMQVEISKLRSNPWIRLYLELAVYTKDRRISDVSIVFFFPLFLHINALIL